VYVDIAQATIACEAADADQMVSTITARRCALKCLQCLILICAVKT